MRITIIGATGFLGKAVVEALENKGHWVMCPNRTELDLLSKHDDIDHHFINQEPEVVINLATHGGSLKYVGSHHAEVYRDNMRMILNLYEAISNASTNIKVINPISNCSYPEASAIQQSEEFLNGPVHPSVLSFGGAKRGWIYTAACYESQYGVETCSLMLPNMYGPGDSIDPNKTHALDGMALRMLEAKKTGTETFEVWGTGTPIREWLFVKDAASVIAEVVDNGPYTSWPINVGQEKGYTVSDIAVLLKEATGYTGKIVFNTDYPDGAPTKILGKGIAPPDGFTSLERGIQETIKYYEVELCKTS